MSQKHNSIEEVITDLKKEKKKYPIKSFFEDIYYTFRAWCEKPGDIYRSIKWFIQRGKRGYSDCDVWGFDHYLSDVIVKGLKDLKKQVHGVPCGMIGTQAIITDDNHPGIKEWKKILGEIIWTFETVKRIREHEWLYLSSAKQRNKQSWNKFARKVKMHIMTKKECERYKNGWKLFQKYYFDLWD